MMKKGLLKYMCLPAVVALVTACGKEDSADDAPILFSLEGDSAVELTKSAITTDNLSSHTVKIYAEKDGAALTYMHPGTLTKKGAFWGVSNDVAWDNGHAYTFQGYAYSISGFTNVADDGLTFTVQQSTNYNDANLRDFIISDKVTVSAEESRRHPVVSLTFDHVLPAIEVYVTRSENIRAAKVTKITLSNLFSKATMMYSERDDVWTTDISAGNARTASYSVSNTGFDVGTDRGSTSARMKIISIPQVFDETTVLTINYKVDERAKDTDREKWVTHTQNFTLMDYVSEIHSGYRTVLHVNVDTGIRLSAGIVKWRTVDFIEGTVLPPIDGPKAD